MPTRLASIAHRPHLPHRTVRMRLTLLYGALFLASGALLLGITYILVRHSTGEVMVFRGERPPGSSSLDGLRLVDPERAGAPVLPRDVPEELQELMRDRRAQAAAQRAEQLRQLLIQSGIALGLMTAISIGLGWLMAGRVLRPLRTMTATTREISEHNLHERLALEGPRDELTELGDTIDDLLERLEAAFEAQRRFVANASHELRTPLAMMRTSLDVAAATPRDDAPAEALQTKLREGLDRADRLLEDFLILARTQDGAVSEQVAVALDEVAAAALAERIGEIDSRGLELRKALGEAPVTGSRTLLAHMVENLIDNAIRHNEPSGWILVRTSLDGEEACVAVENAGERIDQREAEQLVLPFRRLGEERVHSENGHGLGLSIVHAIAGAHGGELELRARAEGGLRAAVRLPAAVAQTRAAEDSA